MSDRWPSSTIQHKYKFSIWFFYIFYIYIFYFNRRKDREMALRRLQQAIRSDEDDYLSASLAEEEQFLAQYKSLL